MKPPDWFLDERIYRSLETLSTRGLKGREEQAASLSTAWVVILLHKAPEATQLYFFVKKLPTGLKR